MLSVLQKRRGSSQKRRPCLRSSCPSPDLRHRVRKCCAVAEFKRNETKRRYASLTEHRSLFFTGLCNRRCGPGSCQSPWASCRRLAAALGCYCHIWQCGDDSAAEPSCTVLKPASSFRILGSGCQCTLPPTLPITRSPSCDYTEPLSS